jgi:hypothetical protein
VFPCFDEVRNTEVWNNNILVPSVVHLHPHKGILSGDGRCCSEREIASSNVKGVFLADGCAKALRHFVLTSKKHILLSKIWVLDWEILETGEKYHPSSTYNKWRQ